MTSEEFGHDLEHVEVLQKKFDEFQKVNVRPGGIRSYAYRENRFQSNLTILILLGNDLP